MGEVDFGGVAAGGDEGGDGTEVVVGVRGLGLGEGVGDLGELLGELLGDGLGEGARDVELDGGGFGEEYEG